MQMKQALIRLKARRINLNSERYCFGLWNFKALILAVDYFTC